VEKGYRGSRVICGFLVISSISAVVSLSAESAVVSSIQADRKYYLLKSKRHFRASLRKMTLTLLIVYVYDVVEIGGK